MKNYKDKVAVITGAGRGIGRGIAERCVQEGMKVVLSGVGLESINKTEADLKAKGGDVIAVQADVSKYEDMERLAQSTLDAYGAVHMLVNNAGVGTGAPLWEATLKDWKWVLDVNLWGVVHGVKAFVPIMMKQDAECHVVNVASTAGLNYGPFSGIYRMSKHAVTSLTETLYFETTQYAPNIGVTCLFPGFVKTDMMTGERNRPQELQNDPSEVSTNEDLEKVEQFVTNAIEQGMPPEECADMLFKGISKNQLYVIAYTGSFEFIEQRMNNILNQENPPTK